MNLPKEFKNVLKILQKMGTTEILARELTKKFEELSGVQLKSYFFYLQKKKFKGEIVLLISGQP